MSKGIQPIVDHRRGTLGTQPQKGSSQTDSRLASESGQTPNVGISSQGALPVLSIPGGNLTDSELADKHRKDATAEVSPEGALPVISVPGGS
jgi:hypothetical protein